MYRKINNLQQQIKKWWSLNPLIYDWHKTLKIPEGSREFFDEIDRRFFNAAFFAQEEGKAPFSKLIDYTAIRGKRVLEIGCGAGALASVFARQDLSISAIDLTYTATCYTKRRFEIYKLKGNILQMDAEMMGFKDATFDFIWSWGVIHHSENPRRVVSEMYRVLRPGGKVAVMVYNRNSIHFWVYLMLIRGVFCAKLFTHSVQEVCNRYSDGLIANYYTSKQLEEIFQKNGFSDLETTIYGQKADAYPLPRKIKIWLIALIPICITKWLLFNFGTFLYLTASKRQ